MRQQDRPYVLLASLVPWLSGSLGEAIFIIGYSDFFVKLYYRTYQVQPQRWMQVVVEQGEVVTAYRVRRLK